VDCRINAPANRCAFAYRGMVVGLERILTENRIPAYHCTRLTAIEIYNIKNSGVRLLSADLVRERLTQCRADGHLEEVDYEYLKNSPTIERSLNNRHGNRTGMIWFCPNRSTLRKSSAVYKLFRYWGGEASTLGTRTIGRLFIFCGASGRRAS